MPDAPFCPPPTAYCRLIRPRAPMPAIPGYARRDRNLTAFAEPLRTAFYTYAQ